MVIMDDDTNPVVSPFSGTSTDAAPPPAAPPVAPVVPPEPVASQPAANQPSWHAPDLPAEPLPIVPLPETPEAPSVPPVPPPEPAAPLPPEGPSFPPPPPLAEPETVVAPPKKKSSAGKAVVLALLFFILAVGGVLGYLTVQKGGMGLQKKAESVCNYTDNPNHPCNGHAPGWSTCDSDGRWGCDQACNYVDLQDGWCEGTTCKACTFGTVKSCEEAGLNNPCGGGSDNGDCNFYNISYSGAVSSGSDCREGGSAAVTIHACLPSSCDGARTYNYEKAVGSCSGSPGCGTCGGSWSGASFTVNPGECKDETVSCSPPGGCGRCQVDLRDQVGGGHYYPNGYGVLRWQNSGCTTPTPTPTTKTTPTPTPTTGVEPCCTNLTLVKVLPDGTTGGLTDLKVGDSIRATITFSGTVENVAVRIKKGGVKMSDKLAGGSKTNTWSSEFTIPATGEYEILGFVKVGGVWK